MRHRLKPLLLLAVGALLLHAAVLGGFQWAWPQRAVLAPPAAALQVRVVAAAPVPLADATPAPVEVPAPPVPPAPTLVRRADPADAPVNPPTAPTVAPPAPRPAALAKPPVAAPATALAAAPALPPEPSPEPTAPPPPTSAGPMRAVLFTAVAEARPREANPPADESIPHYRTRLPPAALLRYELQRGGLSGTGELLWRPDGEHYELRLDGRVGPLAVLTQISSGGFDAEGLAPLRFTDKRLRRPASAANFQREGGKITFSGPAAEYALHAGTQDRLSWMVQLAAIVAGEPALRSAGAKVVMGVVGSHADASIWALRCIGHETVETGAGLIDSIKYLREPRDPYDTTVQVWLDPAHHYLPVHATQKSGPKDEGFSLRLQEITAAP